MAERCAGCRNDDEGALVMTSCQYRNWIVSLGERIERALRAADRTAANPERRAEHERYLRAAESHSRDAFTASRRLAEIRTP